MKSQNQSRTILDFLTQCISFQFFIIFLNISKFVAFCLQWETCLKSKILTGQDNCCPQLETAPKSLLMSEETENKKIATGSGLFLAYNCVNA